MLIRRLPILVKSRFDDIFMSTPKSKSDLSFSVEDWTQKSAINSDGIAYP